MIDRYYEALRLFGRQGSPVVPPAELGAFIEWVSQRTHMLAHVEIQALFTLQAAYKKLRQPVIDWKELVEGLR